MIKMKKEKTLLTIKIERLIKKRKK